MLRSLFAGLGIFLTVEVAAAQNVTRAAALATLEQAGAYFRDHLGVDGTYAWQYAIDGQRRRGEGGVIPKSLGWVQSPGTPAVGAAFLRIYEVTDEKQWLDAAGEVATALLKTQLQSGGWSYAIETDPEEAKKWCYRASGMDEGDCDEIADNPDRNKTMLDDNKTQGVLNFLMWFDSASEGAHPDVRQSVEFALARLMDVQYRNGAVPGVFTDEAPGAKEEIAAQASIPDVWPREWEKPDTPPYFVVNDNVQRDAGRTFLNAYRAYKNPAYLRTAMEIGDFLVSAQLPVPQQGWAQLYDRSLQPVWGRRFEPPAVVSHETAGSIDYLIELHELTSKARYFEVAKSAAGWLKAARLADGSWARFYELKTNRPLYVDNDYKLTFDDRNLLDHYGMKGEFAIEPVLERLERAQRGRSVVRTHFWIDPTESFSEADFESIVERLVHDQDDAGRWVDGEWIDGGRFVEGVFALAGFIEQATSTEK